MSETTLDRMVRKSVEETLNAMPATSGAWSASNATSSPGSPRNREVRRRTRVVGSFLDGRSALMLVCARVRYVTSNEWSTRRYLDMSRLGETVREAN